MHWCIEIMLALFLSSITGSILFALWSLLAIKLERNGFFNTAYDFLRGIAFFWLFPCSFAVIAIIEHFGKGWGGVWAQKTPLIVLVLKVFFIIWAVGALIFLIKFCISNARLIRMRIHGIPCKAHVQQVFEEVLEEMQIPKERILLLQSYYTNVSCIFGVWRPVVMLPVASENYKKEELKVVFKHELTHYQQKAPLTRQIAVLVRAVHFFNPAAWVYMHKAGIWSEFVCDFVICKEMGGIREYFLTILKLLTSGYTDKGELVHAIEKQDELKDRVIKMSKIFPLKEQPKWKVRLSTFLMLLVGAGSIGITTIGGASAYAALYNRTEVVEMERDEDVGLEEVIDTESLEDYAIVEEEAETNPNARGSKSFLWVISGKTMNTSSSFYVKSGGHITVAVSVTPSDKSVYVGIVEPDGTRRCVYGRDYISHTFSLDQTGYYQVYIRNSNSTGVTADGGYFYAN